jgi:chorismate dehydratase
MLRIGRIGYANCTPIFHALQSHFPCDGYEFVGGVPAHLNGLLASGAIDVCPSSSIEYAFHADRYLILPQLSISSVGAVKSVLLFSRVPLEELDGREILLSAESATSVNLLRIIMYRRFGCTCRYTVSSIRPDEALMTAPAMLLIGDAALRTSLSRSDVHIYDLGALWHEWTGLPFVFALWFCTRTAAHDRRAELQRLAGQLVLSKTYAGQERERIADVAPEVAWMGREGLIAYWRDNISYELGTANLEGLQRFFSLSAEMGLISRAPELKFFA